MITMIGIENYIHDNARYSAGIKCKIFVNTLALW